MCMSLNKRVKLPKVNSQGYCLAYKVVRYNHISTYQNYAYCEGVNYSGRGDKRLTALEKELGEVSAGFHLFVNLRAAKFYANQANCKIIEVYFKPVNVVALGTWGINGMHNVVVTKLVVKSLEGI